MMKIYYHVTDFKTWCSIRKQGLKASKDGYIYLSTTKQSNVLSSIAWNQLGLKDYGVISIKSEGISVELEPDKVGESTAKFQRRIRQSLIESKYITCLNMYKITNPFKVGKETVN